MNLKLKRFDFTDKSTIGCLYINDEFFSYTLEDVVRDHKIMHETAIPYGTYEIILNFSNRFQKQMPLLLNVPNYEGVRMHNGSYAKDTSGCVLVGKTKGKDFIGESKATFARLMTTLRKAGKNEKIFIEITK